MKIRHALTIPALLASLAIAPTAVAAGEGFDKLKEAVSINGYLESNGIYALEDSSPDEDPSYMFELRLKSELGSWGMFTAIVQGIDDGKVIDADNGRLINEFDAIYQDKNPFLNIDEAYLDIYTDNADFRIGIQKFAWGRLDEINPTDNLNTEDLTQASLNEESERKIGVPALKANVYTDLINIELGWVPRYVPYRLATSEERWFPPVLRAPDTIPTGTMIGDIPVTGIYEEIDLPAFTLDNSELGIRASRYIAGWDLSVSYFRGYDTMPVYTVPTELIINLENILSFDTAVDALAHVTPKLHQMQVFGCDFSTTYGPFTIRGEYAYFDGKYYTRKTEDVLADEITLAKQQDIMEEFLRELIRSGFTKTRQTFLLEPDFELQMDSMKYGIGLDYIHGDTTLSGQLIQEYIPDYDSHKPIRFNDGGYDTIITLALKQYFLQNTMEANLDMIYNFNFKYYLVRPWLAYNFSDSIKATLGLIWLGGEDEYSLIGQYEDNDQVYAKLRYSF